MQTKSLTITAIDETGVGLAKIAQLSAIDADGDTYMRGAFSWKEQWVYILPAHDRRAMPLGKARIYEDGDWAMAELRLNLDTPTGRDWHATLKFDLATGKPVQEWSYGFDVLDAEQDIRDGAQVRVMKRLDVNEISPVLRGAGVGTGTVAIKGAALKDDRFVGLIAELGEMAGVVASDPTALSATGMKQLGDIHIAIGKALAAKHDAGSCPRCNAKHPDDSPCPSDAALGSYLASLSRRHLPPV